VRCSPDAMGVGVVHDTETCGKAQVIGLELCPALPSAMENGGNQMNWKFWERWKKEPNPFGDIPADAEPMLVCLPWRVRQEIWDQGEDPGDAIREHCAICGGEVLVNGLTVKQFPKIPAYICGGCVVDAHDKLGLDGDLRYIPSRKDSSKEREMANVFAKSIVNGKSGQSDLVKFLRKDRDYYKADNTKVLSSRSKSVN
jgi:hypothetical protein